MERTQDQDQYHSLLLAYSLMVLGEVSGIFVLGVALARGSLLIWATGMMIIVGAFGLDERIKTVYRRTNQLYDAYVATLGKKPLPGFLYHLMRGKLKGYRLQFRWW